MIKVIAASWAFESEISSSYNEKACMVEAEHKLLFANLILHNVG